MSAKDVIKSSFLEGIGGEVPTLQTMLLYLAVAALLGIYLYLFYRLTCEETFYSANFNLSLVLIAVITAAIILTIQSSVIVSLGMVGALSIVRFRTAVKDPLDLVFLFWSICVGIITGTGLTGLAVGLSILVSLLLILFRSIPRQKSGAIYLSVAGQEQTSVEEILNIVKEWDKRCRVRSQNLSPSGLNLVLELRCNETDRLIRALYACEGIQSVQAVAHGANAMV